MDVQLKDPDSVLDWTHDWSDFLAAGETIASSTWSVSPAGELTIDSETETADSATVWLSAGERRGVYEVINAITTDQGRTAHRTITVRVEER